jgi:HAMP domain-containing protein
VKRGWVRELGYSRLFTLVLLGALVLLACAYACSRRLLPALGALKNRYLVEEEDRQMTSPV